MVRAFGNVADTKMKCACEAAEARQTCTHRSYGILYEIQLRALHKVHLIDGLIFVAALSRNLDALVMRHKRVDQINRDATKVVVFERKPSV